MASRKERVIALVGKIVAKKSVLAGLERELAELLHELNLELDALPDVEKPEPVRAYAASRSSAGKGETVPGSIPSGILKIIEGQPDRVFETKDFFSLGNKQSVRGALHRMKNDGQIDGVERGRYRATRTQGGSRDGKP
jgi:DNA-directed RNA polymerase subunit H (RpoH/RPB5)